MFHVRCMIQESSCSMLAVTTGVNKHVAMTHPGCRLDTAVMDDLDCLSTASSGSMVEIKRTEPLQSPVQSSSRFDEEDRYRLVYTKSKVYVNPTAYSRDNIPGFVAIVKRAIFIQQAANPTYLLAWIPETLLNEKGATEWDKFFKVEEKAILDQEDDDGSIGINLINGDTLPTLHFHDDESRSFTSPPPKPSRNTKRTSITSYPPPASPVSPSHSSTSWGGEDLIARLRCYAHVLPSVLQPSLYLIDPSRADLETHSTQIFDDDAVDDILAQSSYANSFSPVPAHRKPRPLSSPQGSLSPNPYSHRSSVLHRSLGSASSNQQSPSQARMALLQSFSNITRATRHAAQNILSHPLAKPIVPHLPDPVKTFVNANGEWEWGSWVEKGGVGEFESARVYLARWARIVAEEGERARRKEAQTITSSSDVTEETSSLGIFELLHSNANNLPTPKSSRDPAHPVDGKLWAKWFAEDGRPKIRIEEMKREIFRRGLANQGDLRKKIWPFILGIHDWDITQEERDRRWEEKRKRYQEIKNEWCGVPEVFDRQDILEQERHRIDVDCRRTDRTQSLFATPTATPSIIKSSEIDDEKAGYRGYSTISPNLVDIGAQSPSNEHIDRLAGILLTYNFYEKELGPAIGYVQGMSDLCAPIYVVMEGEEEMTFWCFVEVMERMKQNFLRDQSGMQKQLSTLRQLIGVMDPELYRHFEKADGLNLFFCFRWVLVVFKREFHFDDILRLWEVLWTDYYSKEFVLFVALAVLESHRDMLLRYLVEFDEILKYCNELSMTIELDTTLAQAEVLFLSFAQLVADIDRRQAEEASNTSNGLRHRPTGSMDEGPAKKSPTVSQDLRDLLKTERQTLTIYDAYPKSIFHFLLLPRVKPDSGLTVNDLESLKTLLAGDKTRAKKVIDALNEDARSLRKEIEEEMEKRYGFKWPIWTGFHGAPSMHHLHLHVLSADLCSPKMKNKKHYNSFHPKLGFFLHIEEVLSWFDSDPSYFKTKAALKEKEYEALLKEDLNCWKCESDMKNIPALKTHLQEEWDKEAARGKAKAEKKRKLEEKRKDTNSVQEKAEKEDRVGKRQKIADTSDAD
ncbi:hypothetical protein D9758_003200 [Tetrapyrgos nigripes]|uniref:Rab-GAP TBC domain-containing protein n=1 Tax=Tetrapyrgos nigripes TaxID=182062 RepID=A0A8H5GJ17_9AGAR|nr:hypothetical protein D9758_003200 [Tetrapyrgos nigripes]